MFRTLFFPRLECGQECVVALLVLRGRKTDHTIMLVEKEERKRDVNKKREKQKEAGTKRASGEKED